MNAQPVKPCAACANPAGGLYIAGCRPCTLRSVARSPEHFESRKAGRMTPGYRALLQAHGPTDEVHAEVKAMFQALRQVAA